MKFPRRFDFVALTAGAVVPDVFEPLVLLGLIGPEWGQRDWTHSSLGACTLDAVLALAASTFLVRPLLARLDRTRPSDLWNRFAGHEFRAWKSWPIAVGSAWLGSLSHVLLDVPFHAGLRLFFPAPRVTLFPSDLDFIAHLLADLFLGPLFAYIVYVYWWRPARRGRETTVSGSGQA